MDKPKTKASCMLNGGRWVNGKCDMPKPCGCGLQRKPPRNFRK